MSVARVVIIGGGITGLTVAFRLRGLRPTLLEASSALGGQVQTELCEGFVIERGAEGFVARSQAIPALVADVGMPEGELIDQATLRSYGFDGQHLQALLPGEAAAFLGFQVAQQDLGRGIRSLRRGMGSLIAALRAELSEHAQLRLGARVTRLERDDSGLRVALADGSALNADAVVVAIPAAAAAPLLAPLAGEEALGLARAVTHSSTTVELAYERAAIEHPLDGSGFVVAPGHQLQGLRACTFSGSKFVARTPPGGAALRLFFRPEPGDEELDDRAWSERASAAVARILPVQGPPRRAWVSRWQSALPVFDAEHRARVAALEPILQGQRVWLAGSAFHGSGLDAAVVSAERAAAAISVA